MIASRSYSSRTAWIVVPLLAVTCHTSLAADLGTLAKATSFYQAGRLEKALPLLETTLQAIDSEELSKQHLNQCLKPLTDVYRRLGEYSKALIVARRYRTSIQSMTTLDERRRTILLRDNSVELADILASLGQHHEAERLWQVAERALPEEVTEEPRLQLLVHVKLAQSAEQQGQITLARKRWKVVITVGETLLAAIDIQMLNKSLVPEVASVLSTGYAATGRSHEAISAQQRLLKHAIVEQDLSSAVRGCTEIGKLLSQQRDFDQARKYLQKGLSLIAKHNQRSMAVAALQQELANVNQAEGLEVAANRYATEAAGTLEQLLSEGQIVNATDRIVILDRLLKAYQILGKYHEMIKIGTHLLNLRTTQFGHDHSLTMHARGQLGMFYGLVGNYARARPLIAKSLKYWQTREPRNPIREAHLINDLAVIERALGSFDQAEQYMTTALELRKEHLPPNDLMLAHSHANLASVLSPQGHYARAVFHYQRAIDIMNRMGQKAAGALSTTLLNIAMTYKSQGLLARAEDYCQQSLELYEEQFGTRARGSVAHHNALAALSIGQSRESNTKLEQAFEHNNTALSICKQHRLEREPVYATALHHRATIAYVQDDLDQATNDWRAAFEIQSSAGDIMQQTRSLVYLAKIASLQKDDKQSEQLYRRAVRLSEDSDAYPTLQYLARCNLAQLLDGRGEFADAKKLLVGAIELLETPRAGTVGAEVERATTFAQFADAFDLLVKWSLRDGHIDAAINWAERARNRTFLDQMRLAGVDLRLTLDRRIHGKLLDDEQNIRTQIGALRTEVFQLVRNKVAAEDITAMAHELDLAQKQYSEIRTNIRSQSIYYRQQLSTGVEFSVGEIRTWLASTAQVMCFYVLGDDQSYLLILGDPDTPAHVLPLQLMVTTAKQEKTRRPLTREIASGLVSQFMDNLQSRVGGRGLGEVVFAEKGVHQGHEILPLAEILFPHRARQIISRLDPSGLVIVPDGALHQLPFESLLLEAEPTHTYVCDLFPPISYAPSIAILMNLVDISTNNVPAISSVLTVGNPLYAQGIPESDRKDVDALSRTSFLELGGNLSRLPGTAEESSRIAQALKHLVVVQFDGSEATEHNVRDHIADKQFVHLAAHGLVDEQFDNCYGAIALAPPQDDTSSAENDGFLELREIQTLGLSKCELAVLSACQTVVGPHRPHEAGSSLTQAFLIAGARRVVCSHWNVDDASTAEMMGILFETIADSLTRQQTPNYAKALRTARLAIRNDARWSAPYYWAPFVLIGPAS